MISSRREFLKTVGVAAAAMAIPATACRGAEKASKPNVLLIFTDDQGTLDANCYGSKDLYTPAIDELAAKGVRFTQAYSHTVCCPARALLMTGRHPQRSNVNMWTQGDAHIKTVGRNMYKEEITIAEHLKAGGYRTGLFGKWHLGAHLEYGPTKQGFDEFYGLRGGFIDNYNHYFLHGKGFHDLYEGTKEVFARDKYFPDLITDRALKFIETNKAGPFFMYLAFNIPHYPEQADKKFDERYKDLKMPRQAYAKMISTVDDRIGLVLKKLNDLKIRDNTIIVFMSDNGHSNERNHIRMDNHNSGLAKGAKYGANGGGGNTGKWIGAKGSFQEGGIRVPAIISYPKTLPSGVVRDQAITAADWYPTISDLCGLDQPKVKLDGQSLLKIIKSPDCATHHKVMHWQWGSQWAVRQGDWKLIGNGKRGRSLGNLSGDKPERENFIKTKPEIVKRLLGLHVEWVKEVMPKK